MEALKEVMTNVTLTDLLEDASDKKLRVTIRDNWDKTWYLSIYYQKTNRILAENYPSLDELTFALHHFVRTYGSSE